MTQITGIHKELRTFRGDRGSLTSAGPCVPLAVSKDIHVCASKPMRQRGAALRNPTANVIVDDQQQQDAFILALLSDAPGAENGVGNVLDGFAFERWDGDEGRSEEHTSEL